MRNTMMLAAALVAVTATSAAAQGRGRNTNGVPPGQRPPDGMCRVWIDGVPPGKQPAPTNCATARLNVPANGRVIVGGHPGRKGAKDRDEGLLTRRRQLADGSWVVDRFRRDANGNITIVSTKPLKNREMKARKDRDKSEDRELNEERDKDKREMKNDKDDKDDMKQSLKVSDDRGDKGNRGGKGKGKH
jgi:hypothetical protein